MIPNLVKKSNTYAFFLSLCKALANARQDILGAQANRELASSSSKKVAKISTSNQEGSNLNSTAILLDKLIRLCLDTAVAQWSNVTERELISFSMYGGPPTVDLNKPHNGKITRIIEIMEHAVERAEMDVIKRLFVHVLKAPGKTPVKFIQIYTPLIPRLKELLAKSNIDINTSPFASFLQILISLYLRDVLGNKGQLPRSILRRIGRGCQDCKPLDLYLLNPTTTTTEFRVVKPDRLHLEQRLASAKDICTFVTIKSGSPHGLQVTKLPEVVAAATWPIRQKAAQEFLASIGTDAVIAQITGARYREVGMALQGTQHFSGVKAELQALKQSSRIDSQDATDSSVGPSDGLHGPTSAALQPMTASSTLPATLRTVSGTKRKNGPSATV